MCTLRFCVDLLADGLDFIRSIMSENCVIRALPGSSIYLFWSKIYK